MEFSDILHRANLNSIEDYLIDGSESLLEPSTKKYSERLSEVQKKITAFFQARYSDVNEYDEISGYFNEQTEVFRAVYLEIGLILGAKIAFQIRERMEELLY